MKYIDVLSKFKPAEKKKPLFDPVTYAIKQSDGVLISLKKEAQKGNLLKHLYYHTPNKINDFIARQSLSNDVEIWVDSGGYDLLKYTKVDEQYLQTYMNYYLNYLENYTSDYHRIFSLDFQSALRKGNEWLNTKDNIFEWNKRSLLSSVDLLSRYQEIQSKFYFVYHYKTRSLYGIWNELYKELDLKNIIQNRAIGGLVSARKLSAEGRHSPLLFSPVIGPAFNALNDYIEAGYHNLKFTLHYLGVSNKIDRFIITFLEELFSLYLDHLGIKQDVQFSYDTRAYSTHANTRARTGEIFTYSTAEHKQPVRHPNPTSLSDIRLSEVYQDENALSTIRDEIDNIIWDEKLASTDHCAPLFIWSNRNLDEYFKSFVNEYALTQRMLTSKKAEGVSGYVSRLFDDITPSRETLKTDKGYKDFLEEETSRSPLYDIWTVDTVKKICISLDRIALFNDWFLNQRRDPLALKELMLQFIDDMGIEDVIES